MFLRDRTSACMCTCENRMGLRKIILLESLSLHYNSSFKCQLWFMACHSEAMKACSQKWPAVRTGLTETGNVLTCPSACLDPATDTGADKDGLFLAHYFHWEHCLGLWLFKGGDTQDHVKIPQVQWFGHSCILCPERDILDCGPHHPACFLQDLWYTVW